jgi:hypothetical protein
MQTKFGIRIGVVWTVLVTIIPTVIGIMLLTSPAPLLSPGIPVSAVLDTIAYRNIVLSGVLLAALLTQPKRTVAYILIIRGLTEWADALSGVFVSPSFWLVPFIGGLGSLIVAYYFLRSEK